MEGLKQCRTCHRPQPYSEFTINNGLPGGFETECRVCRSLYRRQRYHRKGGPKPTWSPDLIKQLKELLAEGLPIREIADRMGKTRNAIFGAMWRAGLCKPKVHIITFEERMKLYHGALSTALDETRVKQETGRYWLKSTAQDVTL